MLSAQRKRKNPPWYKVECIFTWVALVFYISLRGCILLMCSTWCVCELNKKLLLVGGCGWKTRSSTHLLVDVCMRTNSVDASRRENLQGILSVLSQKEAKRAQELTTAQTSRICRDSFFSLSLFQEKASPQGAKKHVSSRQFLCFWTWLNTPFWVIVTWH